jgi:hypothetical protein
MNDVSTGELLHAYLWGQIWGPVIGIVLGIVIVIIMIAFGDKKKD